ncbi:MAG: nucleotidyltransferase domain-containing protein [Mariprofundales bacterium]|nr:nucleotidyltransferase domain-containing protein [Mariprofundales bacterium]
MRLTAPQAAQICHGAIHHFGANTKVWLFGSRVDDHQRGGDIDLYIETGIADAAAVVDARLCFLRALHLALGEQKIDLVLRRSGSSIDLPIYHAAKAHGARLL